MKFCYIDESGTGGDPYAVMVGVIADAHRMRVTKRNWDDFLVQLSAIVGQPIQEIHTNAFYRGQGIWHQIDGPRRREIETAICHWLRDRRHSIVYTSAISEQFSEGFEAEEFAPDIKSMWMLLATHLCLAIQKHHQPHENNKGNTVLVFDEAVIHRTDLIDFVLSPPDWTDTYYRKAAAHEQLDQIVDVPHFVDSRHVGLIQLADFCAFFIRRHIELENGGAENFVGERAHVAQFATLVLERAITKTAIYMTKGRCRAADLFYRYAPACIR